MKRVDFYYWAIGPTLAILLVVSAFLIGFGPGFFTLSIYGAIGFVFVTPIFQWALLRSSYFKGRRGFGAMLSASIVVIAMIVAIASGKFFYW